MLHALQRSLIYFPTREPQIEPREAGLPRGQVHTVTLRTSDQLDLRGWLVLADGRSAESREDCDRELAGRRCVLYYSGNGANRRFRVSEFSLLTSLGLNVLLFDYRGYGENPGSPSEELLAADAQATWDYVTQQRGVPSDRVILYGESLGGAVAVRLAAGLCEAECAPAGLILRSTFSSLVDIGAHHYAWLPIGSILTDRFPAIELISKVTCPLLQIHGALDEIVPIDFGRRLFAAAPERSTSGIAKQFVELSSAGHNDITIVAADELRSAIAKFLATLNEP